MNLYSRTLRDLKEYGHSLLIPKGSVVKITQDRGSPHTDLKFLIFVDFWKKDSVTYMTTASLLASDVDTSLFDDLVWQTQTHREWERQVRILRAYHLTKFEEGKV